jgi:hypothetical protein
MRPPSPLIPEILLFYNNKSVDITIEKFKAIRLSIPKLRV